MPINNDPTDYQQPWRRNYELYAAGGWYLGALGYFGYGCFGDMPPGPLFCTSALCLAMGLWCTPRAVKLAELQKNLTGRALSVVSIPELKKMAADPRLKDSCWLGRGFIWTPVHTQRLYELMRLDWSHIAQQVKENSLSEAARSAGGFFKAAEHVAGIEKTKPLKIEEMGQKWIHGVEPNEDDLWQPLDHLAGHTLIVGTTGAGKTRCFDIFISQAIMRGESVIIIDPKGDSDLRDHAREACEACGREDDFCFFNPAFPQDSVRINPLANFNEVTDIPSRIANLLGDGGADAFRDFGWNAMNQICQGLAYCDKPMTLKSIRRNLEIGGDDLFLEVMEKFGTTLLGKEEYAAALDEANQQLGRWAMPVKAAAQVYRSLLKDENPSATVEGLLSMVEHDKAHFGKMITSLIPILSKLTSGSLGTLLSPDEPGAVDPLERPVRNMGYFVQTKKVVYIGLNSLADGIVGSALGSILLADLTTVAGARYNYEPEKSPCSIFVDEVAEVVNDPLIQMLNKGRGAKFQCFLATQLFADFAAKLGSRDKASQVLGNLNNIIALRTGEPDTQKFIISRMPKTRVTRLERSQSQQISVKDPAKHSAGLGERLVQEEVPLFPQELLGALPGLEFIGVISGGTVIKSRIPFLTKDDMAKKAFEAKLKAKR